MTLMNMNRFILGSMTAFTLMTFASEADGGEEIRCFSRLTHLFRLYLLTKSPQQIIRRL